MIKEQTNVLIFWGRRNDFCIRRLINSNLEHIYYIKGHAQNDGVGKVTFQSPITGVFYLFGCGSTEGYYLIKNGTTVFRKSAGQGQLAYGEYAIEVVKGDTIELYSQGTYIGFLKSNIDANKSTFASNIP